MSARRRFERIQCGGPSVPGCSARVRWHNYIATLVLASSTEPFAAYDGLGWLGKPAFGLTPDVRSRWE
jgi:hypothetical protein